LKIVIDAAVTVSSGAFKI